MALEVKQHVRTCIGCGSRECKDVLHRIVRDKQGRVSFDAAGRAPGRGAYVCSVQCYLASRKARRLERALRVRISEEDHERIASELACALSVAE